jgi:hypothetical protein
MFSYRVSPFMICISIILPSHCSVAWISPESHGLDCFDRHNARYGLSAKIQECNERQPHQGLSAMQPADANAHARCAAGG